MALDNPVHLSLIRVRRRHDELHLHRGEGGGRQPGDLLARAHRLDLQRLYTAEEKDAVSVEGCGFVLGEGARAWTVKPAFCSLERTPVAEQHAAAGSSTCIGATCAPPAAAREFSEFRGGQQGWVQGAGADLCRAR